MVYIGFHTLTDAERSLELLLKNGISAELARMPMRKSSSGCGIAVRVPAEQSRQSRELLEAAGIRVKRTALRASDRR